jgi:hypothetical protein
MPDELHTCQRQSLNQAVDRKKRGEGLLGGGGRPGGAGHSASGTTSNGSEIATASWFVWCELAAKKGMV